ncbi:hypothetical protein OUZ56_003193 [Daphnia magna]|uniref:Uncharacterized protein n=1 Tax=Daphnia magna TaxID=35525 RepID=A0ABR0A813_9CRUS|nr:hypothetical protein OUZ56_003193 [Daphnia magna]
MCSMVEIFLNKMELRISTQNLQSTVLEQSLVHIVNQASQFKCTTNFLLGYHKTKIITKTIIIKIFGRILDANCVEPSFTILCATSDELQPLSLPHGPATNLLARIEPDENGVNVSEAKQ